MMIKPENIDRNKMSVKNLTVAIEKDEGDGHEDGVPVEGDSHILHISHPTLKRSSVKYQDPGARSRQPHLYVDRPVNCENDSRDAKRLNHSQANEEQPSGFDKIINEAN